VFTEVLSFDFGYARIRFTNEDQTKTGHMVLCPEWK